MKSKFTVIIPTRERADTLYYTIQTCIAQNYDNLEIIVCDNCSNDNTREVVSSFTDKRIKYINPGKRLDMSTNWEFALTHVSEGYVTIIGDDDGLLLDSVVRANTILDKSGFGSITWNKIEYHWDNHIIDKCRNYLMIPLRSDVYVRNTRLMLKKLQDFTIPYNSLPCLYNSFINMKIIHAIKKVFNGQFFHSTNPDIFSSIIISLFQDKYLYSMRPLSINGASRHSQGTSRMSPDHDQSEVKKFDDEIKDAFNKKLVFCPSITIAIGESLLNINEILPQSVGTITIDVKTIILKTMQEVQHARKNRYELVRESIKTIGRMNGLEEFTRQVVERHPNIPSDDLSPRYGFFNNNDYVGIDTSLIGIKNVYDACVVSTHLLQNTSFIMRTNKAAIALRPYLFRILRKLGLA